MITEKELYISFTILFLLLAHALVYFYLNYPPKAVRKAIRSIECFANTDIYVGKNRAISVNTETYEVAYAKFGFLSPSKSKVFHISKLIGLPQHPEEHTSRDTGLPEKKINQITLFWDDMDDHQIYVDFHGRSDANKCWLAICRLKKQYDDSIPSQSQQGTSEYSSPENPKRYKIDNSGKFPNRNTLVDHLKTKGCKFENLTGDEDIDGPHILECIRELFETFFYKQNEKRGHQACIARAIFEIYGREQEAPPPGYAIGTLKGYASTETRRYKKELEEAEKRNKNNS